MDDARARIWRVVWRACALSAAVLPTGLIVFDVHLAWKAIRETRLERETAKIRTWEPTVLSVRVDQLRIPGGRGPFLIATSETRCSGARLYYRLTIQKNPRCCPGADGHDGATVTAVLLDLASLDDVLRSVRRFNVRLIDQRGVTLKTVSVTRRQVYLQSDDRGGIRAGEANAGIPWDCEAYSHVERVVIEPE